MEHTEAKPIGKAMDAVLAAAAPSQKSSTKGSTSSDEGDRKRHFLMVFRRWEALFKRADRGDEQAEMWFVAEYYDSLKHLSPAGLEALTKQLKARCTFFPTIKECLDITNCASLDWSNPFSQRSPALFQHSASVARIGSTQALTDRRDA